MLEGKRIVGKDGGSQKEDHGPNLGALLFKVGVEKQFSRPSKKKNRPRLEKRASPREMVTFIHGRQENPSLGTPRERSREKKKTSKVTEDGSTLESIARV